MTWHVVALEGRYDRYTPTIAPGDRVLPVPFDVAGNARQVQTSVPQVLAQHRLALSPAADDLLRAAAAAYAADVRIARDETFDGWTRDLTLHLPVSDPAAWEAGAPLLGRLLAFLTGDRWRVLARALPANYRPARARLSVRQRRFITSLRTSTVALFSGGLDSYIGAIDAIEQGGQVALVGHHAGGQGPTSVAQSNALSALRATYPASLSPFLQCWFSPPRGVDGASEITTRGRSILFLALGIAVASNLAGGRLIVPENGPISLNVPLTPPRLGSLSTRTTHPHLIALVQQLVHTLGIDVTLDLPYRFRTKGEMLAACANPGALDKGLAATMSCAHPGAGRFSGARNPNQHCGYCLPCLIRRAAIACRGADPTSYAYPDLSAPLSPDRGADLRSLRLALHRYTEREPALADVLSAGPLPATRDELRAYVGVFRRGLDEVRQFLT